MKYVPKVMPLYKAITPLENENLGADDDPKVFEFTETSV